jgi:hypothetical protein
MGGFSVAAIDVGALKNIGWWHHSPSGETTSGRDLDSLVDVVVADLGRRTPVALGFEAPLFIPRPASAEQLNRQRAGERGRPWCAGAGTGALALGLQQSAYVFDRIAQHARPRVTFDLEAIERGDADLLAWEAFVSGKAKNRAAEDIDRVWFSVHRIGQPTPDGCSAAPCCAVLPCGCPGSTGARSWMP